MLRFGVWQDKWIEVTHDASGERFLMKARYDPETGGITLMFDDKPRKFTFERIARKLWRLAQEATAKVASDGQDNQTDR